MTVNFHITNTDLGATKSKQWPQYLAVLTASITAWCCGTHFGWPSPSFPIMLRENYPVNITPDDTSYIAMMQPIGDIFGAPLAAALADKIGRKLSILLITPPLLIAWLIFAFAQNTYMFCLGRFISGIGDGFLYIIFPMYVGEVVEPKVRGILGGTLSFMMILGMLFINSIGPFLSIRNTALICAATTLIPLFTFIWMPESPYYLLMKGQVEKAKKSLHFLRRCDISHDLILLEKDVKRQMSETGTLKDILFIKSNRKALLIMGCIRTMQQISGVSAWGIFTQTVFLKANTNMSYVVSSIIYLAMQIFMTLIGSFLVDKYGRKPLLISSSFLCGITLNIGGIYFYFKEETSYDLSALNWAPIVIMLTYVVVFGYGLGTVPSLMLGEMFSASIKSKGLCIMCIYFACLIAVTVKLFHFISELGMYWPFFVFGVCCFLNVIMAIWFVPETKGKTLEDIQQYLKGNKICK